MVNHNQESSKDSIVKKLYFIFRNFIFSYPTATRIFTDLLVALFTMSMALATLYLACETKNLAKYTALQVEYAVTKDGLISLNLTLDILIDSTKNVPVETIDNNVIFKGRNFKKYFREFNYDIIIENDSPIRFKKDFDIYLIAKGFDKNKSNYVNLSKELHIKTCHELGPKEAKYVKDLGDKIYNSGILNEVNIADNSRIFLTIYAVFDKYEGFLKPYQKSSSNLRHY
ncbi:MAG: hypothetical protein GF353_23130 [Candidatus Lokiarchaeota archaeon]|nr:hypothetical protein [Candidatus Lokiarchaeota archaeon]